MTVTTRFAPSPTGYLHIGGARTALYAFLYAKKMQGKFILRIEDTDLERSTPESVAAILESMQWLDLTYDEGPYYQTKRFERYQAVVDQLLAEDKAYRCYCSKERLEALRAEQMLKKEKPRYDGHCRVRTDAPDGPYVIRFKNPQTGVVTFDDLVRGQLTFANEELDDLIIARSDGSPTYNFTVVVDDWDMQVTHVIRGDDHINNTPRQINILKALSAQIPQYAHVPMILGSDGKRLSKRHGAVSVMQYRDEGYLPEALLNYLARLGWSYGDQEIFNRAELIQFFDLKKISRSPAAFNPEKLLWLNHHYIKTLPAEDIANRLQWYMQLQNIDLSSGPSLVEVVKAQAERCKTLLDMANKSRYFYEPVVLTDDLKRQILHERIPAVKKVHEKLTALDSWTKEAIHEVLVSSAAEFDLKLGLLAQPLRIALTGGTVSPPLDATILLIGKDQAIARLKAAI